MDRSKRPGSLKQRITLWEQGKINTEDNEAEFNEEVFLRKTDKLVVQPPAAISNPGFLTRKSLTLSVVFESDEEDDGDYDTTEEDVEDAPLECSLDDDEAEFVSIELAQEALEEVMQMLNRNSQRARESLTVLEDVGGADQQQLMNVAEEKGQTVGCLDTEVKETIEAKPVLNGTTCTLIKDPAAAIDNQDEVELITNVLSDVIQLASCSYDKEIRAQVPDKLRSIQRRIKDVLKDATTAPPPPPLMTPPPPPPLPPPTLQPKPFKIASKKITKISIKRDGDVNDVELRVKGTKKDLGGADMMNQLQNILKKRQNRGSLQTKYEALGK